MKKRIYIFIVILALFWLAKPTIQAFLDQDTCLDLGGSYNTQTKSCEGARE